MSRSRSLVAKPEPTLVPEDYASLGFWAALASVITFFAFVIAGTGFGHASSRALAERSFTATPPFHSPQQAARHIMQVDSGIKAAALPRAQAYAYLKHHGGKNRVFVTSESTSDQLDILARAHNGRDAIVELKGPANGDVKSEQAIWTGSFDWGRYLQVEGGEGGIVLLIVLAAGLADAERYRRRKHEASAREAALLDEWRRYVPADGLYGPLAPAQGFQVLVPAWQERDGVAIFTVERYRWSYSGWHEQDSPWYERQAEEESYRKALAGRPRLKDVRSRHELAQLKGWQEPEPLAPFPTALRPVELETNAGSDVLAERWFDFCKGVADLNAEAWAARERARRKEEARRLQAEAERERVREEQRLKELERVRLDEILQPGHELMRGIGEPQA